MCRKLILDQYCHFDVDKQLDVNMDRAILPMLQIKWAAEELISLPLLVLKKVLIPDRILHWFAFDDFHDDDNDDDDEDGDFFYDDDISDDVSDDDDDDDDGSNGDENENDDCLDDDDDSGFDDNNDGDGN
jgi:hypothetical protein